MARYLMHSSGATTGAVTGRYRVWKAGDHVEAPEGEFRHLPARVCTAEEAMPTRASYLTTSMDEPDPIAYETRPVKAAKSRRRKS